MLRNFIQGYVVKIVEGNGTQLSKMFPKPFSQDECQRAEECTVCQFSTGPSKCDLRSVVYIAECLECWDVMYSIMKDENDDNLVRAPVDVCLIASDKNEVGIRVPVPGNRTPETRQLYVGESSRSLRERASEHFAGAKRMDNGNFISKHWQDYHAEDDDPPNFVFRVHSCHKDALSREVLESLMIQQVSKTDSILNSKSEWNSTPLSRLTLEVPTW